MDLNKRESFDSPLLIEMRLLSAGIGDMSMKLHIQTAAISR